MLSAFTRATHRILQRTYKFGGQPIVNAFLHRTFADNGRVAALSEKHRRCLLSAAAGSLIGVGEVAFLPLDVLKIKMQTNRAAVGNRGVLAVLRGERLADLYKGWGWTMVCFLAGHVRVVNCFV